MRRTDPRGWRGEGRDPTLPGLWRRPGSHQSWSRSPWRWPRARKKTGASDPHGASLFTPTYTARAALQTRCDGTSPACRYTVRYTICDTAPGLRALQPILKEHACRRDLPLSNGKLLVTFDGHYRIRDIYYPHIGSENHTAGHINRIGVWVDGEFAWLDNQAWERVMEYLPGTLVTNVRATSIRLGLSLVCHDCVDFEQPILIRQIEVHDLTGRPRQVRMMFHYDSYLYETEVGDTACYRPQSKALIFYKRERYLLAGGSDRGHRPWYGADAEHGGDTGAANRRRDRQLGHRDQGDPPCRRHLARCRGWATGAKLYRAGFGGRGDRPARGCPGWGLGDQSITGSAWANR